MRMASAEHDTSATQLALAAVTLNQVFQRDILYKGAPLSRPSACLLRNFLFWMRVLILTVALAINGAVA